MIDAENQASVKVARNIGMALEREMRGESGPFRLYSMVNDPGSAAPSMRMRDAGSTGNDGTEHPLEVPDQGSDDVKYMLMMFGDAATMVETKSPEWIQEMIAFMMQLDKDLRASAELVYDEGLADGSTAKTVRLENGTAVATDGQVAGPGASLIGFWVVDVEGEPRALEIASQIVAYAGVVEVRPVPDAPPGP